MQDRALDLLVRQQVQRPVEMHDEPEEDARREDDHASLEHVALHALPRVDEDAAHGRQVVGRKLHHERGRLARERPGLLERDAAEDDDRDADDVHERRDVPHLAEEDRREHRDDHCLRAARDERREDDRHAAVTLILDRPRRHDGRHAASLADDHRDERLARKAELAEEAVHDERDARHVSAVLQEREKQEHDRDHRDEPEHRRDAAPRAVVDERGDHVGRPNLLQRPGNERADARHPHAVVGGVRLLGLLGSMVGRLVDCPFLRRLAGLLVLDGRLLLAGLPRRDRRLRLREVFARRVVVLAVDLVRRERQVPAVAEEPVVRPVGELRAGAAVRDGEKPHHAERDDEDRQREDLVRDDLVDPVRQGQRLRAALLRHGLADQRLDEVVALVRDDRLGVVVKLLLAVADVRVEVRARLLVEPEHLDDLGVALEHLDGEPADGAHVDLALDRLLDVGERMLDGTGEDVGDFALPALPRELRGKLRRLDAALVVLGADADHLAAERFGDALHVDLVAVFAHEVHHIDRDHHRQAQLGELRRQVEVALDVRAVHDVQDGRRRVLDEIAPRDLLLQRIRRERVDARQVLDDDRLVTLEEAVLLLDRHARPVADVLARACQRIEERRLAAVRVARERNLHRTRSRLLPVVNFIRHS